MANGRLSIPQQEKYSSRSIMIGCCTLLFHNGETGSNAVQNPANIDVDHSVPFVDFQGFQRRERHHTGVVHYHIDTAKPALRQVDDRLHLIYIRNVQLLISDGTSFGFNEGCQNFQSFQASGPNDDIGPPAGEKRLFTPIYLIKLTP